MSDSNRILIVAGEESSSVYAQRLLEYWQKIDFPVKAFGVGSRPMEALGFERLGKSEEMAVVGIQEVASQFSHIYKVFHSLIDRAKEVRPQAALLLDYPDFNLRLAKRLKNLGIPVIYYISPQLWAWRSSRIHTIKKYVDKMLVVFPFEVEFYRNHGVDVQFVGHPLLDEIEKFHDESGGEFPEGAKNIRLGLMPGSRRSELKYNLKVQLDTALAVAKVRPGLTIELLVAPSLDMNWVREQVRAMGDYPQISFLQKSPMEMIESQDLILCASGTATLLVGLMKKPFVAMYKMNPFSAFLAKKLIRTVDHFCIVNLILGKRAIPEYFQAEATPDALSSAVLKLSEDPAHRLEMIGNLRILNSKLGQKGATKTVHDNLLAFWSL